MENVDPNTDLTKSEFIAFVLIYAAHIDFEFTSNEVDFIKSKTCEKSYDKMYKLFEKKGDYAAMKVILSHREKYFETEEKQEALYNMLIQLFKVDGDYSKIEKNFLPFFKKMVESKLSGV